MLVRECDKRESMVEREMKMKKGGKREGGLEGGDA